MDSSMDTSLGFDIGYIMSLWSENCRQMCANYNLENMPLIKATVSTDLIHKGLKLSEEKGRNMYKNTVNL